MLSDHNPGVKVKSAFLQLGSRTSISGRSCLVIVSLAIFLLVLFCSARIVHANRLTLEWDSVVHPAVAGYIVYYGTHSRDYSKSVDVGNWTSVTIAELKVGETYYFAVTAYSVYGEESEYSNEVCSNCAAQGTGGGGGCFIATSAS